MCLTAVLGVGSALVGASSANKAAKAQERAAEGQQELGREQMAVAREQFNRVDENLAPFRQSGGNALAAYQFELGLGDRPTFGGTAPQITTIPGTSAQPQTFAQQIQAQAAGGAYQQPASDYAAASARMPGMVPINGDPSNGWMPAPAGGGNTPGRATGMPQQQMTAPTPARYSVNGQMFDTMEQAQAFANSNMTGGQAYGGISMSPGTTFALEQGRDTIEGGASARSGLNSGATLAGLERLRMGLAAQDREVQLNRLGSLAGMGQSAAAMQAANSNAFVGNTGQAIGMQGNALGAFGNAQAAGAIGVGNALQGGLQNLAGSWGYQSAQQNALAPTTSLRPQARPF